MRKPKTPWRQKWNAFRANRKAFWSGVFLLVIVGMSLTAEVWSNDRPLLVSYHGRLFTPAFREYPARDFGRPDLIRMDFTELRGEDWAVWAPNRWGPYVMNRRVERYPAPPSRDNWLGTDDRGRDLLARTLYGFRYSLVFAAATWALSAGLGLVIGALSGFVGGRVDLLLQRLIEILSTVPQLLVLIYLVSIFEPSLTLLVGASCVFGWIGISLAVRGEALRTRNLDFVNASIALGAKPLHVLVRHVLPHCLIPIVTFAPFMIVGNITGLAALDYMGLGLTPPTPSWGELFRQAESYYTFAWWIALFPSLALFLTLLSLTFLGDGLRMAATPHAIFHPEAIPDDIPWPKRWWQRVWLGKPREALARV